MMKSAKLKIGCIFLIGFLNCTNPFTTRTPESPENENPISQNLQTDPNAMLEKIKLAFQEKDTQIYYDCFADTIQANRNFVFIPEQNELDRLKNWQREDERTYFFNLVNDQEIENTSIEFPDQSIPTQITASPDTLEIDFKYAITAEFRTKTERYQGRSILKILKSNEELWYIFEWLDLKDADAVADSTWSTLRANYRISG